MLHGIAFELMGIPMPPAIPALLARRVTKRSRFVKERSDANGGIRGLSIAAAGNCGYGLARFGAWPRGKAADFGSAIPGSNPGAPARLCPLLLAQILERMVEPPQGLDQQGPRHGEVEPEPAFAAGAELLPRTGEDAGPALHPVGHLSRREAGSGEIH